MNGDKVWNKKKEGEKEAMYTDPKPSLAARTADKCTGSSLLDPVASSAIETKKGTKTKRRTLEQGMHTPHCSYKSSSFAAAHLTSCGTMLRMASFPVVMWISPFYFVTFSHTSVVLLQHRPH
eukprot:TRINITY_DN2969_c6_g1_i1.p1 TRINITY_DN2969_c6_g1~~TRINITY_DN2969_c6_g1_i1.p1  ORF type:complete len:122 (-),score=1.37 TRINITY_DN2969_c6_g1_i1:174-539(-)